MLKHFKLANDLILGSDSVTESRNLLEIFVGKPFWIWDKEKHDVEFLITNGQCCFNHIVGLPEKNDKEFPIFNFQKLIYDAVEQNQNIWILKSRGIGLTTFLVRYLAWKILSSSELDDKSIFIITGTRENFGNYIKEKMAKLFERNFPLLNIYTKYTELILKKTWIKVFPTTFVKDIRGYFEASYIWADESAFFPDSVQDELISVVEPYQSKSNCKIILSSTPNKPNDLMNRLESNPHYFKLRLPYDYGINTIYSTEDIEKAKQSVSFEREFNLKYQGAWGNIFTPLQIEQCINLGLEYSVDKIPVSLYTAKSAGVDWGFSSSGTGIVVLEHMTNQFKEGKIKEDIIRVIDCHFIEKGNPNDIVNLLWEIWKKYGFMNLWYYLDAANAGMCNLMKTKWDESTSWTRTEDVSPETNHVIPVSFNTNHKQMLSKLHLMVSKSYIAIDPKYDKLLTSLRTATANELSLVMEQTSYNDLLDGLRLGLKAYQIE
jgi:hypothetical protein